MCGCSSRLIRSSRCIVYQVPYCCLTRDSLSLIEIEIPCSALVQLFFSSVLFFDFL